MIQVENADLNPPKQFGTTVIFCGGAGAPGITSSAMEFADACAQRKLRTLLLDADPYGGKLADWLGAQPMHSVQVLAQASRYAPIMPQHVETAAQNVEGRPWLKIIPGFEDPRTAQLFTDEIPGRLVTALKAQCDVLVIDIGRLAKSVQPSQGSMGWTLSFLLEADHVIGVFTPDEEGALAINRAWTFFVMYEKLALKNSMSLANKVVGNGNFRDLASVMQRRFNLPLAARIPENRIAFESSWANKRPVEGAKEVTEAFDQLVSVIFPYTPVPTRKKAGPFGR